MAKPEEGLWEDSSLAKFSMFLGLPSEDFEEEILCLRSRIKSRRQKGKGKGVHVTTRFDQELKKLEWTVMEKERARNGTSNKGLMVY